MIKIDLEKTLLLLLFLGIGFIGVIAVFTSGIGANVGTHTGYVTAVEYKSNIIFPSNIVYFKTDLESTQEDTYCVDDENLKNKLIQYSTTKTPVTIKFSNNFIMWRDDCNGGESIIYQVDDVQLLLSQN